MRLNSANQCQAGSSGESLLYTCPVCAAENVNNAKALRQVRGERRQSIQYCNCVNFCTGISVHDLCLYHTL